MIWACVRAGAVSRFAHRFEVVATVMSSVLVLLLQGSVWNAAAEGRTIAGFTSVELSTYVIAAWVTTTVAGARPDEWIGLRYRSGEIAADLMRPVSLPTFVLLREAGRAATNLVLVGIPLVVCGALWFPFDWPSAATWPIVALSLGLAFLIATAVALLAALLVFRVQNATGIVVLRTTVLAILSGAVIPLDVLPGGVRDVLLWLPFQGMTHTPVLLFLERGSASMLLLQAMWAVVLVGAAYVGWGRAVRHLVVHGG